MANTNNPAAILNAAMTNIAPILAIGEEHIHSVPYRYMSAACIESHHPLLVHHYRHVNMILLPNGDENLLTSVDAAEDYIRTSRWGVGYFGRMGETFFSPLNDPIGLTGSNIVDARKMLSIWFCYNWASMSGPNYAPKPNECKECTYALECPFNQALDKESRFKWTDLPLAGIKAHDEFTNLIVSTIRSRYGFEDEKWKIFITPSNMHSDSAIHIYPAGIFENKPTINVHYPEKWLFDFVYNSTLPNFLSNQLYTSPYPEVRLELGISDIAIHYFCPIDGNFVDQALDFWKKFHEHTKDYFWMYANDNNENAHVNSDTNTDTSDSVIIPTVKTKNNFMTKLIKVIRH